MKFRSKNKIKNTYATKKLDFSVVLQSIVGIFRLRLIQIIYFCINVQ